jgi:ParB-like chromosome segregation protein Spo0J
MPETRPIALSSIVLPKGRLRAVQEETVNALVQSMAVRGQLQPIVVRRDNDGRCWLVAGLHRFEAARKLKWDEINCHVFDDMDADQAELAEIDENLIRANLTPAEQAIHIGRRKAIYEKLHPETVHGAVGRRGKRSQHATSFEPADSFIDDVAKKTGKHRATIARKAARAQKVSVQSDIIGTALDNGAEIDAMAKLTVEKQQSLAQAAKRGEQVSAIPRDHNLNDSQMNALEEIEQSGCNYPEAPQPVPTLDPRSWSMSTAQERKDFVKAVGRSQIEEAFHAIESGCLTRGLNTLNQAWGAATESDRRTFYRQQFPANVWNRFQA